MSDGDLKGKKPRPPKSGAGGGRPRRGQPPKPAVSNPAADRPKPPPALPASPQSAQDKPKPPTPRPVRPQPAQRRAVRQEKPESVARKAGQVIGGPGQQKPAPPSAAPPAAESAALRRQAAQERMAQRERQGSRPLPAPPQRRPLGGQIGAPLPTPPAANPQAQAEITTIVSRFSQLESEAQLSDVYQAIGRLDSRLTELPLSLESLRARGFLHAGRLEAQIAAFDEHWGEARPRVEAALREQVGRLNVALASTERQVNLLAAGNIAALAAARADVEGLSQRVQGARAALRGLYGNVESEVGQIDSALGRIERLLDLIAASQEVKLRASEGPLAAVEAQWRRDGDDGPEGVLFLTDQRLLFEQREEVATKKLFGLFKTESQTSQSLLLVVAAHEIESVSHSEEGGFLGMGKKDMLDLVLAASAPVARARFHLQGQQSADWAALIKQVQTGETDRERAEAFAVSARDAAAATASFPTQCPNCFAPVPTPPRGATSAVCGFCGTVIMPAAPG